MCLLKCSLQSGVKITQCTSSVKCKSSYTLVSKNYLGNSICSRLTVMQFLR